VTDAPKGVNRSMNSYLKRMGKRREETKNYSTFSATNLKRSLKGREGRGFLT